MRGKLDGKFIVTRMDGITPADAGKTTTAVIQSAMHWDHPRGCGENAFVPKYL